MAEGTETVEAPRSRSWWPGGRAAAPPEALRPVLKALKARHPKSDPAIVEKAYRVAERVHEGQVRKSGEPYITHPVAVATILAELGMEESTLAAALLHDTVEDTPYSLEELTEEFDPTIAALVDGVTKLDKVVYGESAQVETVRKMVIATARDIRVLLIKLADRLHNARTWQYVSEDSAKAKATETLEIYAPLAHRLGVNTIKWELEDLSFATLYPKMYDEVVRMVAERAPARDEYLGKVIEQVRDDLRRGKIKAMVTGRPKHYYSVYQKLIVQGRDFSDIYDLVGVRVLVDSVGDCYGVLGAIHARWNPVPGRFKDYIAMPKFNVYQSLHTTVIGPGGKPVEIQIRTQEMHKVAEFGIAAHWRYKEGGEASGMTGVQDMAWLRHLADWLRETEDSGDFLEELRYDIGSAEVYVFTPKGDVIVLPAEATPVDFAYAVHTEVGHRTVGARVNSRLVALETALVTGDVVEILTTKGQEARPSRDWLDFVKTPRARNKIRQWYTKSRREEAVDKGKNLITKELRRLHLPMQRLMSREVLMGIAADLRQPDVSGLYAAVGEGHISPQALVERITTALGGESGNEEDLAEVTRPGTRSKASHRNAFDPGIVVDGVADVLVKLARCCTPVPGDEILGFITTGDGVSVHRATCANAESLRAKSERIVAVAWSGKTAGTFLVQIQVEALDRNGLLADITRALTDSHVNLVAMTMATNDEAVASSRFTFEMAEPQHLNAVLASVRGVEGVFDVFRVTGTTARRVAEEPTAGGPAPA
ncbi:MAG: bifunctional (p)ppGpp synthetase/guanosine-3',5'-bis(diphosphate) 3'-pyrophosphohydrolase [Micrococcales bacterium]|nr:bifunctional (p)ppGpp synthetase/guanosine-3',5'-bis(diphosphate) 3'-pyrophosphohydrolase [Micrococcales bacterium]